MQSFTSLCSFVLIGVSLTSGSYDSTRIQTRIGQWAEKMTLDLKGEVSEKTSYLQELVDKADKLQVKRVTELYEENKQMLERCKDIVGADISKAASCINITGDIANITALLVYGYQLADDLGTKIIDILQELNHCSTVSIWKQLACYLNAFKDIQTTIKNYSVECSQFLQNVTAILKHTEVDISGCFSYSEAVSIEVFENKIELCKLESL